MTSQQHRRGAIAAALAFAVFGAACSGGEQQSQPDSTPAGKDASTGKTEDAGGKTPRDAGAPDVTPGKPDAGPDAPTTPPTTPTTPPTTPTTPPTTPTTPPPPPPPPPTTPPPTTPPTTPTTPPTTPTTPPTTTPSATTPLRIGAIGDFGTDNSDESDVSGLVHGWKPDHVITLGDNNYEAGAASTIDANIGKYYHDFIGNYVGSYGAGSATNRFWPSPGNHDWGAPNLKPYTDYFTLPGNERYYDVDLGLVHLYAIDSDPHEPDGTTATSKQALWLKEKLAASKSCYDLVYFHHAAYSSSSDHGSTTEMRWPFEAWGAEAVMAGHDHTYERFQVGGIPYFVNGLGAAGSYPFGSALPETKVRYNSKHGAMLLTATATGITFEFWTHDGQKIDSLTVPKTCQ